MFDDALEIVLRWEGGYVNDPNDPGGETKFGICRRSYPDVEISTLTRMAAAEIYQRDYWKKCNCDAYPVPVGIVVFDCAVNQGAGTAVKLLQRVANVPEDGVPGERTARQVQDKYTADPVGLVRDFCGLRLARYIQNPNYARYGRGWAARLIDVAIRSFLYGGVKP